MNYSPKIGDMLIDWDNDPCIISAINNSALTVIYSPSGTITYRISHIIERIKAGNWRLIENGIDKLEDELC